MGVLQHDGILELCQQELVVAVVALEMLQLLRAIHPGSLRAAYAPIIGRLQLPKVAPKIIDRPPNVPSFRSSSRLLK